MSPRDILLILVAFAGIAAGVLAPGPAGLFTPAALYLMMAILFLSFLRLDFAGLVSLRGADLAEVAFWSALKLIALPLTLWAFTAWLAPSLALPVLLVSGVSTGVTAPFMSALLGGDTPRVLQITVVTSLLLPVTLPGLVDLLMGRELTIPFWHMARLLAMVIFLPSLAALAVRKFVPNVTGKLQAVGYPISLTLFFLINAGVFAPYAHFLREQQAQLWEAALTATILGAVYAGLGLGLGRLWPARLNALTGAMSLTFINNVLVVVFAARFFGPEAPLLAAAYMLPYFSVLLLLRKVSQKSGGNFS